MRSLWHRLFGHPWSEWPTFGISGGSERSCSCGAYEERTLEEVVTAWRELAFGSRGTQTHVRFNGHE